MLSASHIIFENLKWQVVNGESISLQSKFQWQPTNPIPPHLKTVKDLMMPPQTRWDKTKIMNLYKQNTARKVTQIPISLLGTHD